MRILAIKMEFLFIKLKVIFKQLNIFKQQNYALNSLLMFICFYYLGISIIRIKIIILLPFFIFTLFR